MEGKVLNEESVSISSQIPQADYHAQRSYRWSSLTIEDDGLSNIQMTTKHR